MNRCNIVLIHKATQTSVMTLRFPMITAVAAMLLLSPETARAEGSGCASVLSGTSYDPGRSSIAPDDSEARRLAASRTVFFDTTRRSCMAYGIGESACRQVSGTWHRDRGHGAPVCEFRPVTASAPGAPDRNSGTPDRATCDAVEVRLQQFGREEESLQDRASKLSSAGQYAAWCAVTDQIRSLARRQLQFMMSVVQGGCPGFGSSDLSIARDRIASADQYHASCLKVLQAGPAGRTAPATPPATGCGVVPGERRPVPCANGQLGCHCLSLHNNCPWSMIAKVQVSGRSFAENIQIPGNSTSCQARTGQGSHQTIGFHGASRASDGSYRGESTRRATPHDRLPVPTVTGIVHLAGIGDHAIRGGEWAGTKGQARAIEGMALSLGNTGGALRLDYACHPQTGSEAGRFTSDGGFCGTRGQRRPIEAIQIRLAGPSATDFTVRYACHIAFVGDTGPVSDGVFCGHLGRGRQIEAIRVWIERRSQ